MIFILILNIAKCSTAVQVTLYERCTLYHAHCTHSHFDVQIFYRQLHGITSRCQKHNHILAEKNIVFACKESHFTGNLVHGNCNNIGSHSQLGGLKQCRLCSRIQTHVAFSGSRSRYLQHSNLKPCTTAPLLHHYTFIATRVQTNNVYVRTWADGGFDPMHTACIN